MRDGLLRQFQTLVPGDRTQLTASVNGDERTFELRFCERNRDTGHFLFRGAQGTDFVVTAGNGTLAFLGNDGPRHLPVLAICILRGAKK